MNDDITKTKRGGSRPGAGRKTLTPDKRRVSVTVRLAPSVFQRLAELASRSGRSKTTIITDGICCLRFASEIKRTSRPKRRKIPMAETIIDV